MIVLKAFLSLAWLSITMAIMMFPFNSLWSLHFLGLALVFWIFFIIADMWRC